MENLDSRIAHSHEASTDERASSFNPGVAAKASGPAAQAATAACPPPARPVPDTAPRPDKVAFAAPSFASPAEAEAFWRGVAWGARSVAPGRGHPHLRLASRRS